MDAIPWFKVDDHFHSNKKVLRIPRNRRCASVGLWVLVGTWATSNLTDGRVPDYIPEELGGTPRMVDDLVKSGLWTISDGGEHNYPNWEEYQPTREKVEDGRDAAKERMRAARAAAAAKRASHAQNSASSQHVRANISEVPTNISEVRETFANPAFANPDPTRPDPTRKKEKTPSTKVDDTFAEFWDAYPKKVSKQDALKRWTVQIRTTSPAVIIEGARVYAAHVAREQLEAGKIKNPDGWLNGKRWEDNLAAEQADAKPSGFFTPPPAPADMPRELFTAWNRAHVAAWREGAQGPADWHELREAS